MITPAVAEDQVLVIDNNDFRCQQVKRSLPGKRVVCRGVWRGKDVYAKLYMDPRRAEIHWQRELSGIQALLEKGIETPPLLFSGQVGPEGFKAIVLETLPDPIDLESYLDQMEGDAKRLNGLCRIVDVLARHHQSGLVQTDLHPGNFLLSNGVLYTLDGAGIKQQTGSLSTEQSLENLALLLAQFYPDHDRFADAVLKHYLAKREWEYESPNFEDRIVKAREGRYKEYQGKIWRNCTEFLSIKSSDSWMMIKRDKYSDELRKLLDSPDESLVSNEQLVKDGNSSTLWRVKVGDTELLVKRYNARSFLDNIKQRLRYSRALTSWRNANMLRFFGIPTPEVVAVMRRRTGYFSISSYFITYYVPGDNAMVWFDLPEVAWDKKVAISNVLVSEFNQLKQLHISHGDMKSSNFIINDGVLSIIDLDSMHRHKTSLGFSRAWRKDMERFMCNWAADPKLSELFSALQDDSP